MCSIQLENDEKKISNCGGSVSPDTMLEVHLWIWITDLHKKNIVICGSVHYELLCRRSKSLEGIIVNL